MADQRFIMQDARLHEGAPWATHDLLQDANHAQHHSSFFHLHSSHSQHQLEGIGGKFTKREDPILASAELES